MLKKEIQRGVKEALKSGDSMSSENLRMLLASIFTKEKEKRYKLFKEKQDLTEDQLIKKSELSDEQIIDVIFSEIKKRKDAIVLYEKGNRPELVKKESEEAELLKRYLPKQLSGEELKSLVLESIAKTQATEIRDMGKIMADLMPKVKGKVETSEISKIVKELLSK